LQRASGHEGVVVWVDTCPGQSGMLVTGGLDGTVRIWVDVNEDDDVVDGLKIEQENGVGGFDQDDGDVDMHQVEVENGGYDDTPRDEMSIDGRRTPERDAGELESGALDSDGMEI
jgi:COMPASS component SWD3